MQVATTGPRPTRATSSGRRRAALAMLVLTTLVAALLSPVTAGTAAAATLAFQGSVSAGDAPWGAHQVTVDEPALVTVDLSWDDPAANLDVFLKTPPGPDGTVVAYASSAGVSESLQYHAEPGTYEVVVGAVSGAAAYTVAVDTDPDAAPTQDLYGSVESDTRPWSGRLLDLDAPGLVTATLTWDDDDPAADLDLYLKTPPGPDGRVVAFASSQGEPEQVVFYADPADGDYELVVGAAAGAADYVITASVDTTAPPTTDLYGAVDAAGQRWSGRTLDLTGPSEVTATLNWDEDAPVADLDLYLKSPTGDVVAFAETADKPETLAYTVPGDGAYEFVVGAASGAAVYHLSVAASGADLPPAAPANLTASGGDDNVKLDWSDNAEPDLAGYRVYRSETSPVPVGAGAQPLNDSLLTSSAFTDIAVDNGVTYLYAVTAVDTAGQESAASPEASATPQEPVTPALLLSETAVALSAPEGANVASAAVTVDAEGDVTPTVAATVDYPDGTPTGWLAVDPATGIPGERTLSAVTDGLPVGTYTATATFTADGYTPVSADVTLDVVESADTTAPTVSLRVTGDGTDEALVTVDAGDEPDGSGLATTALSLDGGTTFEPYDTPVTVTTPGDYTAVARATDNAGNSADSDPVAFTVTPPVLPALVVSETSVALAAQEGDSDAAAITVMADGDDTPSSVAAAVEYAGDASGWLTVDPADAAPGERTLTADANGLTAGTYTATVTFDADGWSSAIVDVVLQVTAAPVDEAAPSVTVTVDGDGTGEATVTVDAVDEPDGSGVDPATVELSLDDGASFQPYTGPVSVTDAGAYTAIARAADTAGNVGASDPTPFTVTAPAAACEPYSTLPCEEIPVTPPVDLGFDGADGGLVDKDGEAIGFTAVDPPSNKEPGDPDPADPTVPGYVPGSLDVDPAAGTLTVTATNGIQYQSNATSSNTNSLQNALAVGVDADAAGPVTVQTVLTVPNLPGSASSEQAGLWFGLGEDDLVKLVVANTGNDAKVQLQAEVDAQVNPNSTDDELDTADAVLAEGDQVTLTLVVDPAANSATGFYAVGDGAPVQVSQGGVDALSIPAAFTAGADLGGQLAEPASLAGVFATTRRGPATLPFTFSDFQVTAAGAQQDTTAPTASVDVAGDGAGQATVTVTAADEPDGSGLAGVELSLDGGQTFAAYTDPVVVDQPGDYTAVARAVDNAGNETTSDPVAFTVTDGGTGEAFAAQVNFNAEEGEQPDGYLHDFGQAYGVRDRADQGGGTYTYGWIDTTSGDPISLVGQGRDRETSQDDQRLDTVIHMEHPSTPPTGFWQIAVPDGFYEVTVAVGEPTDTGTDPEVHSVYAEGAVALVQGFEPTGTAGSDTRHTTGTATVQVTDGALTLDYVGGPDDPDGTNTKLNSVEVTETDPPADEPPAAPQEVAATAGDGEVTLQWAANAEDDLAGYRVYRAEGDTVAVDPANLVSGTDPVTDAAFVDPAVTNGTQYAYVVTAVDAAGQESAASATVTVTPDEATTFAAQVNFNEETGEQPAGYLLDFGQAYAQREGGLTYGWVAADDGAPLDLTGGQRGNGRDRDTGQGDQRLDSLVHMQADDIVADGDTFSGVAEEGVWELAVPNGAYEVTVAVGDPNANDYAKDPEVHALNVEGVEAVYAHVPPGTEGADAQHAVATVSVGVTDGKLTLDALGGTNTKVNYVDVQQLPDQPFAFLADPANRATGVDPATGVATNISAPGDGIGVDPATLDGNVHLYAVAADGTNGAEVVGDAGSTGGNDSINFDPDADLAANTTYRYVIEGGTDGVKSESGAPFLPFSSVFTTGEGGGIDPPPPAGGDPDPVNEPGDPQVAFEVVDLNDDAFFTTLEMGPDGKLYGTTNSGQIKRWTINPDGTLGAEEVLPGVGGGGPRLLIGLEFDEDATADNPIAWVTHTSFGFDNVGDRWGGKVSRLSGPDLEQVDDVFVNLPRSEKDHVTNSIEYGPDGDLYFLQGSNLAAGAPDGSWGTRPETKLTAAVLAFDEDAVWSQVQAGGPIDVMTDEPWPGTSSPTGSYDPFASGAPLTVYATGIRNAYDLAWHSNGELYVPTNGTAAGGESPSYGPGDDLSYCSTVRADGLSPGNGLPTSVQGVNRDNPDPAQRQHEKQRDFLYRVEQGGYYGHPNPARCEWVLNIGNPQADPDEPGEGQGGSHYDVGTPPDPNYRGYPNVAMGEQVFDLEFNKSPNGVIEYTNTSVAQGELAGRLLVVRFSNNNDVLTVQVDDDGTMVLAQPGSDVPGFGQAPGEPYRDPLEIIENPATGDLYLAQYDRGGGDQRLFLLRPTNGRPDGGDTGDAAVSTDVGELVLSTTQDGSDGPAGVTVTTTGGEAVTLGVAVTGADAAAFTATGDGAVLQPGQSTVVDVTFTPSGATGSLQASLELSAGGTVTDTVALYGLSAKGQFGGDEPTLQQVLDTLGHPVDVGWTGLAGGTEPGAKGDEVLQPLFQAADDAAGGTVTMTPVAAYAPMEVLPFGWYVDDGAGGVTLNEVGALADGQQQTLYPQLASGGTTFTPGDAVFGFYYDSNTFDRVGYTEDARNDGDNGVFHRARVYPAVDRGGDPIPDAYLVAFEDASNGDYQDYVFLITGVTPASDDDGNTGGGGDETTQVNFQPDTFATPADWTADTGLGFDAARGYGWVAPGTADPVDMTAATRARTGTDDPLLQTLVIMQNDVVTSLNAGSWEHEVPAGTYEVTVSAGDGQFADSTHTIVVEGEAAVDGFVPAGPADFQQGTVTVPVTDGRLTLSADGSNTKVNWVTFTRTGDVGPDETDPTVAVDVTGETGPGGGYLNAATVTITAGDIGGSGLAEVTYTLDGGAAQPYTGPFEVTGAGEHTVVATATDGAGNTATDQVTFTVETLELTAGALTLTNPEAAPFDDRLVMSRIQSTASNPANADTAQLVIGNDGAEAYTISALDAGAGFAVADAPDLPVTIAPGEDVTVTVAFTGVGSGKNQNFEADLTITSNAANGPTAVVELGAIWQTQSEGGNEPNVAEIVEAYGLGTTIVGPGEQLNNQGRIETIGDEVLAPYWRRLDTNQPVTVRQLAAYHTCCSNTASFFWFPKGDTNPPNSAAKQVLTHNGQWAQTLRPRIQGSPTQPALASFTPGAEVFGFKIDPEWGDPAINQAKGRTGPDDCSAGPDTCGHHVRVWPVEDRDGTPLPGQYLVVMDYSGINYDFNDNVYLLTNITPDVPDEEAPATPANLTGTADGTGVSLDWDDNAEPDLAGYLVSRDGEQLTADPIADSAYQDPSAPADSSVTYEVVAVDGVGNASAPATVTVDTPAITQQPVRINAGGPAYTAADGRVFAADQFFSGGKQYTRSGLNNAEIEGTDDDVLYRTERSGTAQAPDPASGVSYAIPVQDGTYTVALHFAEIFHTGPAAPGGGTPGSGKRVFDVLVEDGDADIGARFDDVDINDVLGPLTAGVQTCGVDVVDGTLDVQLLADVSDAKISAIEVIPDPDATPGVCSGPF